MPEPSLTFSEFVTNWRNTELSERASYQAHFMEVCRLIGYETPSGSGTDPYGNVFQFDRGLKKQAGNQGFADVYLQGHFAIEYKAPDRYKDLRAAYDQLLQYRENLQNPPLLIVTDIQNWEIHTNWANTEKRVYSFTHEEIATRTVVQDYLRHIFTDPSKLHPNRNTAQVTADAAKSFEIIANNMREWQADPERIAHFLTKIVFCLFAEDVSLLPSGPKGETGIFSEIIEQTRHDSERFQRYTQDLFKAMADGGDVLFQQIPYFNGSLFEDVAVENLKFEALSALENASRLNWESVEPAIFGTLFERSLDPDKRAQLGAHYTSREDILLIVNPVLMRPLERQWEQVLADAQAIRPKFDEALATSNKRNQTTYSKQLETLREDMLASLRDITVLDPACGSGNFLYVALQRLMDMEKEVIKHPVFAGLAEPFPEVHPRQMYGIEINPIAHALASIVVWIGYLQWRRSNGYLTAPKEPILEDIHSNIVNMDAILAYDADGTPTEPEWASVDVILGNPPVLGDKQMRGELGDKYVDDLRGLYDGRVAGGADLVTYWFEKARASIEKQTARRAGLLSTNSIRDGSNREVLKRIKDTGDIFMAWSDREWTLEGAAVNVSIIGFDNKSEYEHILDNLPVKEIFANLTATID
ncbi:MAG: DNA methyltransferase, partial [Phototrophicaceae bacterium]